MSGNLSTRHVVLGLLIERPSYGYKLQKAFGERFGFLQLTGSAIYSTLERLEADGLIEEHGARRKPPSARAVPRIRYRATRPGVDEFRKWLAAPSDRAIVRDELSAKLLVSDLSDLPTLLETADRQARQCLAELEALKRTPPSSGTSADLPWPATARLIVDDFQARWLEALVDWLEDTSDLIARRIEQANPSHDLGGRSSQPLAVGKPPQSSAQDAARPLPPAARMTTAR